MDTVVVKPNEIERMEHAQIVKQIEDQRWKSNPSERLRHRKQFLARAVESLRPEVEPLEAEFQAILASRSLKKTERFVTKLDEIRARIEPLKEQVEEYRKEITDLREPTRADDTDRWPFVLEPLFDTIELFYIHFFFLTCTLDNFRHTAATVHMRIFAEKRLVESTSEEWTLDFAYLGGDIKWFYSELLKTIEPMDRAAKFMLDWWTDERLARWKQHYRPLSVEQVDQMFLTIADLLLTNGRLYPIIAKNFREFVTLKRQYNYKNKNDTPVQGPGFRAARHTRKHRKYFIQHAKNANVFNEVLR